MDASKIPEIVKLHGEVRTKCIVHDIYLFQLSKEDRTEQADVMISW